MTSAVMRTIEKFVCASFAEAVEKREKHQIARKLNLECPLLCSTERYAAHTDPWKSES